MHRANRKGTILITLIVAMLLMGVLGAGIYSLTTTSTFTGLLSNRNDQAYQLAQAGVRYAVDKLLQANPNYSSTDFLLPDSDHMFNITIVDSVITSVGIVNAGTFFETRRQIIYDVNASWRSGGTTCTGTCIGGVCTGGTGTCSTTALPTHQNSVISLSTDAASFTPSQSVAGAITVNSTTSTITLGGSVGGNSGTVLYQGSSSTANCKAGACNFNYGLNAYFEFTANEDNATTIGDGFTFGVFSAVNNTRDRSGGAPSGVDMGSLMGYAGSDRTSDYLGLKPPKMVVEFDLYMNAGAIQYNGCSGNRNDNPNGMNHIALLFWGQNLAGNCSASSTAGSSYPQASWDDNVHGAGDGTTANPYNSAYTGNGSGSGYYEGTKDAAHTTCKTLTSPTSLCNWMEDGYKYGFRLEIARDTAGDTTGLYQINGWIYRLDLAEAPTGSPTPPCTTQLCHFQDVTNSYLPYMTSIPQISKTITLSATNHADLQRIYWGFTEATGAANENIQISKLDVFFPQTPGACLYYINPTSAFYALAGGSGTVSLYARRPGPTCNWTAVSNNAWITVTGGGGNGNGTVSYTVAANTGLTRTGSITIAGLTFTVTQTGCTYTLTPTSRAHTSAAATNQLITVTASSGTCVWTAVSSDITWLTVTSYDGTGSGPVRYSITANTGPARIGYIYIGDQTFTVTQASGCTYTLAPTSRAHSSNAATGQTVTVTTGTICPWTAVSNNAWITVTDGASGTGNGTVTYSITANTTGAIRTGTITIGGQTFTVTQAYLCPGYRVWNNTGSTWDFQVTGQLCRTDRTTGSEITTTTASTQLQTGETVNRYTTVGGGCSSAVQGDITYTDAVAADINGNCRINYNAGDVAGDR